MTVINDMLIVHIIKNKGNQLTSVIPLILK